MVGPRSFKLTRKYSTIKGKKFVSGVWYLTYYVDAPIINKYKLTLECKVVTFDEDENGGARVVGEIVNMSADESILDEEGNIDLGKLQPVIFDSAKNEYRVVGEKVGTAWGSGKTIQEREVK